MKPWQLVLDLPFLPPAGSLDTKARRLKPLEQWKAIIAAFEMGVGFHQADGSGLGARLSPIAPFVKLALLTSHVTCKGFCPWLQPFPVQENA